MKVVDTNAKRAVRPYRVPALSDSKCKCIRESGWQGRTGEEQHRHVFKVPTLRTIALTAPYLHDDSQQVLATTVQLMGKPRLDRE